MTTIDVLRSCVPSFALVGFGLYCLLTARIASWRQTWLGILDSLSRLAQFGVVKPTMTAQEGVFDEKAARRVFMFMGWLFVLLGTAGIVWTAYLHP